MNRKFALVLARRIRRGQCLRRRHYDRHHAFTSTKSRAEVQAELAKPHGPGGSPWSMRYDPLAGFKSKLTRAQVQAEYIASREEVAALNGEDSGSAYLARGVTSEVDRTRLAGQPLNPQ